MSVIAKGYCNKKKTAFWEIDDTGKLTISGQGDTGIYSFDNPLQEYSESITSAVVTSGITGINDDFFGMSKLKKVELADTVHSIYGGFKGCTELEEIIVSDELLFVTSNALEDTKWYRNQPDGMIFLGKVLYKYKGEFIGDTLKIKDGTRGIARGAFCSCSELKKVEMPESVIRIAQSNYTFHRNCESMLAGGIGWTLENGTLYLVSPQQVTFKKIINFLLRKNENERIYLRRRKSNAARRSMFIAMIIYSFGISDFSFIQLYHNPSISSRQTVQKKTGFAWSRLIMYLSSCAVHVRYTSVDLFYKRMI